MSGKPGSVKAIGGRRKRRRRRRRTRIFSAGINIAGVGRRVGINE
jgi:hypothetical protein